MFLWVKCNMHTFYFSWQNRLSLAKWKQTFSCFKLSSWMRLGMVCIPVYQGIYISVWCFPACLWWVWVQHGSRHISWSESTEGWQYTCRCGFCSGPIETGHHRCAWWSGSVKVWQHGTPGWSWFKKAWHYMSIVIWINRGLTAWKSWLILV